MTIMFKSSQIYNSKFVVFQIFMAVDLSVALVGIQNRIDDSPSA